MSYEEELQHETKAGLVNLIKGYDRYIIDFFDEHDESCTPVCFLEWYNNEYLEKDNG